MLPPLFIVAHIKLRTYKNPGVLQYAPTPLTLLSPYQLINSRTYELFFHLIL
uniref:Uncharacterized protein n=1 Tax=uncultured Desulfobacterium sp. TaxID=201089 RepID=E1YJQ5_9BACT|nr:unknown protein [uncultured Desulfobacterium sp.]